MTVRPRNRLSAKKAGTAFETAIANYLSAALNDDRIERRARRGSNDRGDISGLRHMGERVVVEVKNTARVELAAWAAEAEIERRNDDATSALIVSKRHGKGARAGRQDRTGGGGRRCLTTRS